MITLSSDFGDPYPAAMKGVLLCRTDAQLVDVSHSFSRQDVHEAAFWLRETLPEFPPAVHLVVVDPGVGTDRKALAVRAGGHALVGPDNGVLLPAARELVASDDGDGAVEAFEIAVEDPASRTFHGRDVFAPAASDVHEVGVSNLHRLPALSRAGEFEDLRLPEPDVDATSATGEVLAVDDFGNVVTNVPGRILDGLDAVTVDGERVPVVPAYAFVEAGDRLVTVGSHGNVEFAVNRGRGDEAFGFENGDAVTLSWS